MKMGSPLLRLICYASMRTSSMFSMGYIFARCDEPQGKLYHYQPKVWKNAAEMEQFVEMCFDPKSPYYNRMKDSVLWMFWEAADE